jgi:predicted Kef-type K+ transport protein
MSRQYFEDLIIDPPNANQTAVTATTITSLWNVPQFSPIHAFDGYRVGKAYRLMAGGIVSTSASASTLIISPFFGTTTAGIALGASGGGVGQNMVVSLTNVPWFLHFVLIVRTVGAPGANSTVMGTGVWNCQGATGTIASNNTLTFGGTSGTVDLSVESGICIGWTLSVAGSCTPMWVTMQSLN